MTNQKANFFDRFSPYISFHGLEGDFNAEMNSAALRAMLINKTNEQVGLLNRVLALGKSEYLPEVVKSLGQESPTSSKAIRNMLEAFSRFLGEPEHADIREKLAIIFRPRDVWVHGHYCVTCPALLVIQAIMYSHCEWLRGELFESYSSVRAYEELELLGYPEQDCLFIAAIIAHQTLLKASWSIDKNNDPPEVLALYKNAAINGEWHYANNEEHSEMVSLALRETLFKFLPKEAVKQMEDPELTLGPNILQRELVASLVLQSLCLYCRHSRFEDSNVDKIKLQALQSLDDLLKEGKKLKNYKIKFIFLHYGRYVHQSQYKKQTNDAVVERELNETLYEKAKDFIRTDKEYNNKYENITFCFQRVASKKIWTGLIDSGLSDKRIIIKSILWSKDENTSHINSLVEKTVGKSYIKLRVDAQFCLERMLNLESYEGNNWDNINNWISNKSNDTINVIKEILDLLNEKYYKLNRLTRSVGKPGEIKFGFERYFPAPLVGLVLTQLRNIRPEMFSPLHIICRGIGGQAISKDSNDEHSNQFTVWLPNVNDKIKVDAEKIWDEWGVNSLELPNAEKMIARFVAAMVIGRSVSYTPRQIMLDYYTDEARDYWGEIIKNAIDENGGPLMQSYATQINCAPTIFKSDHALESFSTTTNLDDYYKLNDSSDKNILNGYFSNKYVLGIDIGGGSIRIIKLKPIDDFENQTEETDKIIPFVKIAMKDIRHYRPRHYCILKWFPKKPIEWLADIRFKDRGSLWILNNCIKLIKERCEQAQLNLTDGSIIAIGVSLAAPIDHDTGLPLSTSGPLSECIGVTKEIGEINPIHLHQQDFMSALEGLGTGAQVIKILNDGEADIRDTQQLNTKDEEGIVVELKAGTGIAVAVRENGKLLEVNSETAKAILNLLVSVQHVDEIPKNKSLRFQEGVLSGFVSKNGLRRLVSGILFEEKKDKEYYLDPGEYVGKLLDSILDSNTKFEQHDVDKIQRASKKIKNHIKNHKSSPNVKGSQIRHNYAYFKDKRSILDELKKDASLIYSRKNELNPQSSSGENDNKKIRLGKVDEEIEIYALGCAWRLGHWLADTIALIVDIFGAREIHLAGGPLSGATGILIATSAKQTLEQFYGFDLKVEGSEHQLVKKPRIRELKRLHLVYPPITGSNYSGARGAAKAAFDDWIVYIKRIQLRRCRDLVFSELHKNTKISNGEFSALDVLVEAELYEYNKPNDAYMPCPRGPDGYPVLVTQEEVTDMLCHKSAALRLTRTPSLNFRSYENIDINKFNPNNYNSYKYC